MFKKWFRKRKIKKYAKTLPLELRDLYGHRQYYSQEQVDAAVRRRNRGRRQDSSADSICYAYAMYCSPQEFEEIHIRSGEDCNYEEMRETVCEAVFGSTAGFNTTMLYDHASREDESSSGSSHGSHSTHNTHNTHSGNTGYHDSSSSGGFGGDGGGDGGGGGD